MFLVEVGTWFTQYIDHVTQTPLAVYQGLQMGLKTEKKKTIPPGRQIEQNVIHIHVFYNKQYIK